MGETLSGPIEILDRNGKTTLNLQSDYGLLILGNEGQDGDLTVKSGSGKTTAHLDGSQALLILGGEGADGDLSIRNENAEVTAYVNGSNGQLSLFDGQGHVTLKLDGYSGNAFLGGHGVDGDLILKTSHGDTSIHLDAEAGNASLGGPGRDGDLILKTNQGDTSIHLDAGNGKARFGVKGQAGSVVVNSTTGDERIRLDGDQGELSLRGKLILPGSTYKGCELSRRTLGFEKSDGTKTTLDASNGLRVTNAEGVRTVELSHRRLTLRDNTGQHKITLDPNLGGLDGPIRGPLELSGSQRIRLNSEDGEEGLRIDGGGRIRIGGKGCHGSLELRGRENEKTIKLYGHDGTITGRELKAGNVTLGDTGHTGRISLYAEDGIRSASLTGTGRLHLGPVAGTSGWEGRISLSNQQGENTIILNGQTGQIYFPQRDCAEDFDVVDDTVEAGDVVVFDDASLLHTCDRAYDPRVAGVVSGAGSTRPGIVLGHEGSTPRRKPVALAGRVFCKVDADHGAIAVGDLLTSSPTAGHAMKATEPSRAFGATIGKAMAPLAEGKGLVPILVAMQ